MQSLLARLSIALLTIVVMAGAAFFVLADTITRLYYEEVTQRLNAPIAMYIADEQRLISDGRVDEGAVATLARQAMIINPSVEIYLLDPDGRILAHALPRSSVVLDRVDLGAIRAFMENRDVMPLRGTDPRDRRGRKIFSAHPVAHDGVLEGYVYAVLGGEKYDALAGSLRRGYNRELTLGALAAIVLIAFLTGLLVFTLLTRRLRRLTADVRSFTDADFNPAALARTAIGHSGVVLARAPGRDDEIGQLRSAFAGMAGRIRDQLASLEETDRMRRELVTNVSHDLRTPLASMHGYIETLLIRNDSLSADERRHYLKIAHKHSRRLTRLVGDLFELSRLETASAPPSPEYFSLAELLHDVSQEFELEATDMGVALNVAMPQSPTTVFADIGLVQRVLENLIRNALKFTPQGGEISVSLENRPHQVAVSVADTGSGIAPDDLERIFDRYYRSTDKHESASAGLGLAIVRRILDLHGCRITVTSELNRGTRFEFALPTGTAA